MAFINNGYDPGITLCARGTRAPGLIELVPARIAPIIAPLSLLLVSVAVKSLAQDSSVPIPQVAIQQDETSSRDTLRAILRIEDLLRSNQIATEQSGRETRESAARDVEVLSKGLQTIEQAFSAQQEVLSDRNVTELQAMQGFNRTMLIAGGTFATLASLTILMVLYFQWRTSRAWAEISRRWSGPAGLGGGSTDNALDARHSRMVDAGPAEDSNSPLARAIGQLETQVQKLENTARFPLRPHARSQEDGDTTAGPNGNADSNLLLPDGQASVLALLGQGRARMKANDWEAALECFDEILARDPNHSEALVKKGTALERLRKLDEAFECYDRAIAADDSMTVAYLHKGCLCSRLERFKEALECYEKALRTHAEWGDSEPELTNTHPGDADGRSQLGNARENEETGVVCVSNPTQ